MAISSTKKHFKVIFMILLAGLTALSPLAIDTYIAAMPTMAKEFSVGINLVELTITLYFMGFAFGNFIGGPISDSFGRKKVALSGVALYGLSALIVPLCTSIEQIMFLRVLQAIGGGFATVTANVFVRDLYEGREVARFVTIISMIMLIAPMLAPVLGSFLLSVFGWKSIFIFLSVYASLLLIIFALTIPETRDKKLITYHITARQILEKYKAFFSHKEAVLLLFSISLPMSGMYLFITSVSFIYLEYFGIEQSMFPIYFGANIVLNVVLSLLNTYLLRKYRPRNILRVGLIIQTVGGLVLMLSGINYPHSFIPVFLAMVVYIGSLGLVFGNGAAMILNINPDLSGSANATIGIMRFLISFVLGSVLALFHTYSIVPVITTMFICSLLGNLLLNYTLKYVVTR